MVKHVLSNNSEVSHAWAHNHDPEKSQWSGSLKYEGSTLYSYHLPIAVTHRFPTTETVFIFAGNASVTTNKHIHIAKLATTHMYRIYVPNVRRTTYLGSDPVGTLSWAVDCLEWMKTESISRKSTADRARTYVAAAVDRWETTNNNMSRFLDWIYLYIQYYHLDTNSDAVNALALLQNYRQWYTEITPNTALWEAKIAKNQAVARAKEKEHTDREMSRLEGWKAGADTHGGFFLPNTYLRLRYSNTLQNPESAWVSIPNTHTGGIQQMTPYVQTSKGVNINISDAMKAIGAFKAGCLLGQKVNGFTITKVDTDAATITAGCHTIELAELDRIEGEIRALSPYYNSLMDRNILLARRVSAKEVQ